MSPHMSKSGRDIPPTPTEASEATQFLTDLARSLGVAPDKVDEFTSAWSTLARGLTESPQDELLFRVNARLQGTDPGEPVNWRGVNGL